MTIIAIRPAAKLLVAMLTVLGLLIAFKLLNEDSLADGFFGLPLIAILVIGIFVISDLLRGTKNHHLEISRELPINFSFNRWQTVTLNVTNNNSSSIHFMLAEHIGNEFELEGLTSKISIEAEQRAKIKYRLKALKRGPAEIGAIEVCIDTPQQLWQIYYLFEISTSIKVYPDFNRINQSESLKGVNNLPINGLKQLQKRGQGIEFHQLREFREGDSIRQIDWQATSKRQKLIAREYQEEQNQHVIVMLDAGGHMNAETELGTHFDAALNALLMLSHTVLKQGDWFSMQSFNQQKRWLAAVKGAQNVSRVMNHFYDLYPDESAADYMEAVTALLTKRSKRALVLMVTSVNDQNMRDLLPALKRLQQHHLVALVNIENQALQETINADIQGVSDADRYCAAIELKNSYTMNLRRLMKEGILCVDTKPEHLLPYVINTYLNVKHSGML